MLYSTGVIGPIANSGQIIGDVEIDNQANVIIDGGSGSTFGLWTGGTITVGNGNLTFAEGNATLSDDVSVNGGAGLVTNSATLKVLTSRTIAGSFTQTTAGVLDLALGGTATGGYGALTFSSPGSTVALDGGLALDLVGGFTLASGDEFSIVNGSSTLSEDFTSFSLDGIACSAQSSNVWKCWDGFKLTEEVVGKNDGLYLFIDVSDLFEPPPGVPEASTWAMLVAGFLGLGGLARRRRSLSPQT